jgi:hypothetical protein
MRGAEPPNGVDRRRTPLQWRRGPVSTVGRTSGLLGDAARPQARDPRGLAGPGRRRTERLLARADAGRSVVSAIGTRTTRRGAGIHHDRGHLRRRFPTAVRALDPAGRLWVAWPKKAAQVGTDLTFEIVQGVGLDAGLVDNKSASIDDIYQGLQFVIRLKDRAKRSADRPT